MFTGIIEEIAAIEALEKEGENLVLTVKSNLTPQLKVDQSVAHNGVCLTVVEVDGTNNQYQIVAIKETLHKSTVKFWKVGDFVNLELAMKMNDRFDGHIVQGHVDTTARCVSIIEENGSWLFKFEHEADSAQLINKGSIAINGTSLTIVEALDNYFTVAIIPYTFNHTTFKYLRVGDEVNIEFDIVGKYVLKSLKAIKTQL